MVNNLCNNKIILLVGMMGAGKTQIGKGLAQSLDLPFYDTDVEIEKASGMRIRDMFEIYGEQVFRETEQKIMVRLLNDHRPKVISSGGGAYLTDAIREISKQNAISVWINSSIPILLERVRRTKRRPLVDKDDAVHVMVDILRKRRPMYEDTDIRIDNEGERRVHDVVEEIVEKIQKLV